MSDNYYNPQDGQQKKPKALRGLFFVIGLAAGLVTATAVFGLVTAMTGMLKLESGPAYVSPDRGAVSGEVIDKINEIDAMMEESFLFDMDEADTGSGMIKGYMNSFGDPYTVYYTAEEYNELMESMEGTFSGIGVLVQKDEATGYLRVVRPYTNAPAYAAGIREEDLIIKADGEDLADMDIDLAVTKIRGEEGTSVELEVYRSKTQETLQMTVVRQRIAVETVTHRMLDNGIGYISMDSFDGVTYKQYMEAFNDLKDQGMQALIVDIRGNGGGLLDSVTEILCDMLPEGVITYTETKDGKRDFIYSTEDCALDVPMAVLVNGYSASASEIFTGALQDYGAAVIVGTQTFGKGIVQSVISLPDGSGVKFTTSRYYTPNGVCIHGVGITPDIVVEPDPDSEEDVQLQAAIDAMLEKIGE